MQEDLSLQGGCFRRGQPGGRGPTCAVAGDQISLHVHVPEPSVSPHFLPASSFACYVPPPVVPCSSQPLRVLCCCPQRLSTACGACLANNNSSSNTQTQQQHMSLQQVAAPPAVLRSSVPAAVAAAAAVLAAGAQGASMCVTSCFPRAPMCASSLSCAPSMMWWGLMLMCCGARWRAV